MEPLRQCKECKEFLSLSHFHSSGKTPRGKPKYKTLCRPCQIEWLRNRHFKRVEKYIKLECIICGYDKCKNAIDLHHTDPTQKEMGIGTMQSYSDERVKIEVAKCVALCKNCHSEFHAGVITLPL